MAKSKKIVEDKHLIVCGKCGEKNTRNINKCIACGHELEKSKSCPRCAKINDAKNKKCVNCGFKFNNRKKTIIGNLIFSVLLLIVLFLLLIFDQEKTVIKFTDSLRIGAIFIIAVIVINIFTYGKKEKIDYDDKYGSNKKKLSVIKNVSLIILAIGFIIAGCVALYLFFTNK